MTLYTRLRSSDPEAISEVAKAITTANGVLADVGRLLGHEGTSRARTMAAGRLVKAAGLDDQLAAIQKEHHTGRSGRRPRRVAPFTISIAVDSFGIGAALTPETRARCVDERGMATAILVVDQEGKIVGALSDVEPPADAKGTSDAKPKRRAPRRSRSTQ